MSFSERFIVGFVPEKYLKLASDIEVLRKVPGYLGLQSFSDPPQLSDLKEFNLEQQDIKELQNCKPRHCEVQLPVQAMEQFRDSIDWSAPEVADRVNRLAQQMALQALLNYMQGGNAALGL